MNKDIVKMNLGSTLLMRRRDTSGRKVVASCDNLRRTTRVFAHMRITPTTNTAPAQPCASKVAAGILLYMSLSEEPRE